MRRFLLVALILPVLFGCASSAAQARQAGTTVNLVAYSTPKDVMGKLIARFQHQPAGQGVSFSQSYGPSGSQAKAIVAGQPADIAFLSTGLDIDTIVDAGLVSKSWTKTPQGGIAADSVVAFVVLFKNVVSQPSSGSNAASAFFAGQGDVLITYESEAYAAFAAGAHGKLVVPKPTMLIQLPMVATKSAPAAAEAFIKYVHAPKQQKIFAANGYRPVVRSVLKSPDLAGWRKKYATGPTFNINDKLFGGWRKVNKVWFDLNNGRMLAIERAVGGPTH